MKEVDLVPQIRKAWTYAKALEIDELFSGPTALNPSDEFKVLAVSEIVTYEELYLVGLRDGQYNILLRDFSFFQFGIGRVDDVRFAYFPNPFLGAAQDAVAKLHEMREYVTEGVISMEEFLHSISEIRQPRHPPLVRYEYSKDQYVETSHPCSHMHLGLHGENRWPVRRHLTANAFVLLVFRLFYLRYWMKAGKVKECKEKTTMDAILETARAESRILGDDEFSEVEAQRFYLF